MALSKVTYHTDGVQLSFPITFPYMDVLHVKVFKDTVLQSVGTDYTIVGGSVVYVAAPSGGQTLEIKRATKSDAKVVTFHDASVLTAPDQEAANTQLFYLVQESLDSSAAVGALAVAAEVAIAAAARAESAAAAAAISHSGEFYADNSGTADAIVVDYPTAPNTLTDGYRLTLGLPAPNATATPTVVISLGGVSQPSRSFVKANGAGWATLVAGDLQGDVDIRYDLPNTRWIVMNPAKPVVFSAVGATDPVPLSQVNAKVAVVQAAISAHTAVHTACQFLRTTALAIPASVWTPVGYYVNGQVGVAHAVDASGFPIVPVSGVYRITAQATVTAGIAFHCEAAFAINGAISCYGGSHTTAAGWYNTLTSEWIVSLTAGQVIQYYLRTQGVAASIPAWGTPGGGGCSNLIMQRIG